MRTPTWAGPLDFDGLDLHLSTLDVMVDLDPYWVGWATAIATTPVSSAAHEVSS